MTPDELTSFAVLNLRRSPAYANARILRAVLLSIAVLLAALGWYWISHSHPIAGGFAAAFAALCVWVTYTVSEFGFVRSQRAFSKDVAPFTQHFVFSQDGVTDGFPLTPEEAQLSEEEADSYGVVQPEHHAWSAVVDLCENELVLALYLTAPDAKDSKALVFPKRVVDAGFRSKVEQSTGKSFVVAA